MAHLDAQDAHKLLLDSQHAFRKRHRCETQLTREINDWAKILEIRDRSIHSCWILIKNSIHPLMNSLKVN